MHGRDRKNWARFAVLAAEIHLAWSSSSTRPDASPAAKREQYCDSRHNSTIFQTAQAAEATMKSALVLAAAANALVAPSAPAASTVVRQGVIQTPPILTREDGLETRPMVADSA